MDLDYETALHLQEEFQHEFIPSPKVNLSDSLIARQLQEQFDRDNMSPNFRNSGKHVNEKGSLDSQLARSLQEQFNQEDAVDRPMGNLVYDNRKKREDNSKSLVDPSWEVIDPTPDIHVLFIAFNTKFFWGKLDSVCVSWSKKMKRCAGVCSYQGHGGMCHITLSEPLLKLRPRKDLIETLLHEMIHALLFVTNNNRDRDGHGPEFHKHMYRINAEAGTNITVYHDFHDEVELYLQHWWRCDGPCQKWKPYFGIVRRSVNRAPGPNDRWWGEHSRNCGGTYTKIKSPQPKTKEPKKGKENKSTNDIRKYIPTTDKPNNSKDVPSTSGISSSRVPTVTNSKKEIMSSNVHTISTPSSGLPTSVTIQSSTNNIHGFSNFGNKTFGGVKGATKNASNTIVINKKPSTMTSGKDESAKIKTSTSNTGSVLSGDRNEIHDRTSNDYAVVRNHWVNKFSNLQTIKISSSSSSSINSNKRKSSEDISPASKSPKLKDTCSQDSLDCERVPCPVCNISYPIDDLNKHLDMCLNHPPSIFKECIVCSAKIKECDYQLHVNDCLKNNFDDDVFIVEQKNRNHSDDSVILVKEDSMDVNTIVCSVCDNTVLLDDLDEHLKICSDKNKCPECGEKTDEDNYDVHLAECLMKKLDEIDERFNAAKTEIIRKHESPKKEEMVDCLACGKNILKSDLNSHLDECLNTVFKDEKSQKNPMENDDKMYNCPFCLKLISEIEMSDHIDSCLKTVDNDEELENNKSVFLNEIE